MSNHHFVPQYYFRLFTGGRTTICAYLTQYRRYVQHALIKRQCARRNFYGSAAIESMFSQLEGNHALALRAIVNAAESGDPDTVSWDQYRSLIEAVVFQRARTMLEVKKEAPVFQAVTLALSRDHLLRTLPADEANELVAAIDSGAVEIQENPTEAVFRQIQAALESVPLLVDMDCRIIRNCTDKPFIFSDSPVVFYNMYYRNIKDRGVLGFQTRGLQIFLPLTSRYQVMLIDAECYTGAFRDSIFCDVTDCFDVAQLNILQLHHSHSAAYFADPAKSEYVEQLFRAHAEQIVSPQAECRFRSDLLVDGESPELPILHAFEPQLKHDLSLSFVVCTPVSPCDYVFRHRSPELVAEHTRRHPPSSSDIDCYQEAIEATDPDA